MKSPTPLPRMARAPQLPAAIRRLGQASAACGDFERIDTARLNPQARPALRFAPGAIQHHKRATLSDSAKLLVLGGWVLFVSLVTYLAAVQLGWQP